MTRMCVIGIVKEGGGYVEDKLGVVGGNLDETHWR